MATVTTVWLTNLIGYSYKGKKQYSFQNRSRSILLHVSKQNTAPTQHTNYNDRKCFFAYFPIDISYRKIRSNMAWNNTEIERN